LARAAVQPAAFTSAIAERKRNDVPPTQEIEETNKTLENWNLQVHIF
jgi:hypothetical protein